VFRSLMRAEVFESFTYLLCGLKTSPFPPHRD
jgi:hypothetical protein